MGIDIAAIRARHRARREGTSGDRSTCEEDVDALLDALDGAIREIQQLSEDNDDLRASATIWADLYEASIDPDHLRSRDLLEAIAILREAVEDLLMECTACVPRHGGQLRDFPVAEFCDRCARAAQALHRSTPWSRGA